eukprot:TRINITY_DN7491_c0_g1_i5.p1 TRINITY_DN7491_c0_g1~~TRINITY_DN7491_c0_g1_i5.p1  ORF type:complete len:162 (-),score=18.41 TRINITY_DN7491_c0_g1_i5:118-582(-)
MGSADKILTYIRTLDDSTLKKGEFVQGLTKSFLDYVYQKSGVDKLPTDPKPAKDNPILVAESKLLKVLSPLLKRVSGTIVLQASVISGLAEFLEGLEFPSGMFYRLAFVLHHEGILNEKAFSRWQDSDPSEQALAAAEDFLKWLKEADEEDEEE